MAVLISKEDTSTQLLNVPPERLKLVAVGRSANPYIHSLAVKVRVAVSPVFKVDLLLVMVNVGGVVSTMGPPSLMPTWVKPVIFPEASLMVPPFNFKELATMLMPLVSV